MKTRTVGMILTFLMIAVAAVPAPMPIDDFSGLDRLNPRRCGA